jgi:hypothetical protein
MDVMDAGIFVGGLQQISELPVRSTFALRQTCD